MGHVIVLDGTHMWGRDGIEVEARNVRACDPAPRPYHAAGGSAATAPKPSKPQGWRSRRCPMRMRRSCER